MQLDYDYFKDKIGTKFTFYAGEFIESELGNFIVTEDFISPAIHINNTTRTASVILSDLRYDFYSYIIGSAFDIVKGEITQAVGGRFIVSKTFMPNCIYVNSINKTVNLVSPKDSYIGKRYGLRQTDCVSICFEWHDNNKGTNLKSIYSKIPNKDFYKYYLEGMGPWLTNNGFTQVQEMLVGDVLVYEYKPQAVSHTAVYLGNNKILQHLPTKRSGIDILEPYRVKGIYRYV